MGKFVHAGVGLGALLALSQGVADARPRAGLTDGAKALLGTGGLFLVVEDNLALPVNAKGKPSQFLLAAPKRLELLEARVNGDLALAIEDELYLWKDGALELFASKIGAMPWPSPDGKLVASINDKKTLTLTAGATARNLPYRRQGRWEFENPYITPDAAKVLVDIKDYSQDLDVYAFLVVDVKTLEYEEVALSKNFVPGPSRRALGPRQVAIQMFSNSTDENGLTKLDETNTVVFDFATHKMTTAPAELRFGRVSPSGLLTIAQGELKQNDEKTCGAR